MSFPLFETIAIEQGIAHQLAYHQARYEQSLYQFYGRDSLKRAVNFAEILSLPPELAQEPLVRARIDYNAQQIKVAYFPYQRRNLRNFLPVAADKLSYSLKWTDRSQLDQYYAQRGDYDEIMLVQQQLITDCSIGNLIFKRQGQWFTPKKPLLAGTQRQYLLDQQKIECRDIYVQQLELFEEVRLINALNPLQEKN